MTTAKFTQLNTLVNEALSQHAWIEADYFVDKGTDDCIHNLTAVAEHGCASGAYMPAVTYHTAREVMHEHGDRVIEYIYDVLGEVPLKVETYSGMCVHFLSMAVELLAQQVLDQIEE